MDSSFLPAGADNGSAGGANNGGGAAQQAPPIREQDRLMPIANVIRIMRRVLPAHAKISDDAKETIQECVSEYISFITGEANERCQREQRKTITAEDVLWAMSRLGFDDYVEPLSVYLHRYREFEGEARGVGLAPAPPRGDHHHHHHSVPPSMLNKSRGPGSGAVMLPHHHHHDMHASMYGGAVPPPPHHGFLMPHPQGGHYLPYPYEPTSYGGEHALASGYYGGAAYAPGNNGGSGDGSGGSASHAPPGGSGGGFDHPHTFAYK
ncbi:Nuclear transcription factor Y subunit B-6 [Zea mays]|jgi:nuclear transcription Y subunit beta|uniref:Nuclear transcription factor Y subunit B-6 n=2 Tax=Zea mays TaxID=4577 RepID=K7UZ84_MAIZE|eukprot:XP_008679062.1 nuclear transcription factor Y subunit B-2 [Zea mays]